MPKAKQFALLNLDDFFGSHKSNHGFPSPALGRCSLGRRLLGRGFPSGLGGAGGSELGRLARTLHRASLWIKLP